MKIQTQPLPLSERENVGADGNKESWQTLTLVSKVTAVRVLRTQCS